MEAGAVALDPRSHEQEMAEQHPGLFQSWITCPGSPTLTFMRERNKILADLSLLLFLVLAAKLLTQSI